MAEQTIPLLAAWYGINHKRYSVPSGRRPAINRDLRHSNANRFLGGVAWFSDGRFSLQIGSSQTEPPQNLNDDLSSAFEASGSVTAIIGDHSLTVAMAGADLTEPYLFTPSNSAELIAFQNALPATADAGIDGMLIIRDVTPLPPIDESYDSLRVGDIQPNWAFIGDRRLDFRATGSTIAQIIYTCTNVQTEATPQADVRVSFAHPEGPITYDQYVIQRKSSSSDESGWSDRTTVDHPAFSGVVGLIGDDRGEYDYRVVPVSMRYGRGRPSRSVRFIVSSVPRAPAPTVMATSFDTLSATVTALAGAIYEWQYTQGQTIADLINAQWSRPIQTQTNTTTISGLAPSTFYAVQVRYVMGDEVGGWSGGVFQETQARPELSPPAPTGVTLSITTAGVMSISWDAVTPRTGTTILRYEASVQRLVLVFVVPIAVGVAALQSVGSGTSFTFSTMATFAGQYSASVRAVAEDADGNEFPGPFGDSPDVIFNAGLVDAEAPNMRITAIGRVAENGQTTFRATVDLGTYDDLSYMWQLVGSTVGDLSGTGAEVTYNAPAVTADTSGIVDCTVTATGDGTTAVAGTSDTATDREAFTIVDNESLPVAAITDVFISGIPSEGNPPTITDEETFQFFANVQGTYDEIDYRWEVNPSAAVESVSEFQGGRGIIVTPADVSQNTIMGTALYITVRGAGLTARLGTSATDDAGAIWGLIDADA